MNVINKYFNYYFVIGDVFKYMTGDILVQKFMQ